MGVLLTYISEYRICELTRTVHTVTESITYISEFREHCSLPLWHVRKRSFLGPEFTKFHLAAGPARISWGSLQRSPRPLAVSKEGRARDGNEREMERKGTVRSKEKREIKGKGGFFE